MYLVAYGYCSIGFLWHMSQPKARVIRAFLIDKTNYLLYHLIRKMYEHIFDNIGVDFMINPRLMFYNYSSFYDNSSFIRENYLKLTLDEKYIYKYYVYSRRLLREKTCDIIWEFLNTVDDFELEELRHALRDEWYKYN